METISEFDEGKAERILNKARKTIGKYCMEECKSYCCRKGCLVLTEKEMGKVTQKRRNELMEKGILKKLNDNKYSLNLGNYDFPCPCLKDFKCIIHKSKNRPETCRLFPVYIDGNLIKLSPRCSAVRENLLYPYIIKLLMLGYKIHDNKDFIDSDFYTKDFYNKK